MKDERKKNLLKQMIFNGVKWEQTNTENEYEKIQEKKIQEYIFKTWSSRYKKS